MKVAIMQPYFFPYIGYFQLIAAVDLFVVYDNVQYTKKGWINRNRILVNDHDVTFSLPLKKDSDGLDVNERILATSFKAEKLLAQISGAYRKAPYFMQTMLLLEPILLYKARNLFDFLHNSLVKTAAHLEISTPIKISSEIPINHSLKSQDKVLAICRAVGADSYINTIGGQELYSKSIFFQNEIILQFMQTLPFNYEQFGQHFVPWLSIIDVLMFNPVPVVQSAITHNYKLI